MLPESWRPVRPSCTRHMAKLTACLGTPLALLLRPMSLGGYIQEANRKDHSLSLVALGCFRELVTPISRPLIISILIRKSDRYIFDYPLSLPGPFSLRR